MNECQVKTLYAEYRQARHRHSLPYTTHGIAWAREARLYHAETRIRQRNQQLIDKGLLFLEHAEIPGETSKRRLIRSSQHFQSALSLNQ